MEAGILWAVQSIQLADAHFLFQTADQFLLRLMKSGKPRSCKKRRTGDSWPWLGSGGNDRKPLARLLR
jgi:hypothetical protein